MTIATIIIKSGPYTGNDSTVVFAYDFRILAQTELIVTKTTISTGTVATLVLTTDYTVSGVGDAGGGDVTTVATPTTDEKIFIYRSSPLVQATDFLNQGAFFPEIHEDQFDKIINIIQELNDQLGRQPALDIDSTFSDLTLSDPVASKLLGWNSGLTGLENFGSLDGSVVTSTFWEAVLDETTLAASLTQLGITDAQVQSFLISNITANMLTFLQTSLSANLLAFNQAADYGAALQLANVSRKNLIINGDGRVQQRGDASTANGTYVSAGDRFEFMAEGTLVTAGTATTVSNASVGSSGYAHKIGGVTITGTGVIHHRHRIESKDAVNLKNKTATVSVKVYHDVGSAKTFTLYVRKADVLDTFSAVTEISNDGGTSVNNTTATTLIFNNVSMGDCSNGIELELKAEVGAITTKNIEVTEWQIELGDAPTEFERRPYGEDFALCRRYYRFVGDGMSGFASTTSSLHLAIVFDTPMRAAPTVGVLASPLATIIRNGAAADPTSNSSPSDGMTVYGGNIKLENYNTALVVGESVILVDNMITLESEL